MAHCQPSLKISCKSIRKFLRKVANRQTDKSDRQTNNDEEHNLLGGGNTAKLATLTYSVLAHNQPLYLSHLLTRYTPACTLCSRDEHLLAIPTVSTVIDRRGFSYTAPSIWDEIPVEIRNSPFLASFKKHLKTLFYLCLPVPKHCLPRDCLRLRFGPSGWLCARYKCKYCTVLYWTNLHCDTLQRLFVLNASVNSNLIKFITQSTGATSRKSETRISLSTTMLREF